MRALKHFRAEPHPFPHPSLGRLTAEWRVGWAAGRAGYNASGLGLRSGPGLAAGASVGHARLVAGHADHCVASWPLRRRWEPSNGGIRIRALDDAGKEHKPLSAAADGRERVA